MQISYLSRLLHTLALNEEPDKLNTSKAKLMLH